MCGPGSPSDRERDARVLRGGREPRAAEPARRGAAPGRTARGTRPDAVPSGRLLRRRRLDPAAARRDLPLQDADGRSAPTHPPGAAGAGLRRWTARSVRSRSAGARRSGGARGHVRAGAPVAGTDRSRGAGAADRVRNRAAGAPGPATLAPRGRLRAVLRRRHGARRRGVPRGPRDQEPCAAPGGASAPAAGVRPPPATPGRPLLEVWLVRRLGKGLAAVEGTNLQWVPLAEVVELVGAPVLHEPRTLAALTVAARSELVPEWPSGPGRRGEGEARESSAVLSPGVITREWTIAGLREPPRPGDEQSIPSVPDHFLSSQLSWLEFNGRVLALAEDPTVPLLARVRFLSIFRTNLDEFFMVQVGALKHALQLGAREASEDGLSAQEQLDAILIRSRSQLERYTQCLFHGCLPQLAAEGIRLQRWSELSEPDRAVLRRYFKEQVFPLLTPQRKEDRKSTRLNSSH